MNKLTNIVTLKGIFDNTIVVLNSNPVAVDLTTELSINKSSNKSIWKNGPLTYTLTITNESSSECNNLILSDRINPLFAQIIEQSIMINDTPIDKNKYEIKNGLLSIYIDAISPNSKLIIKFKINRIRSGFFELKNIALLKYKEDTISSNSVVITAINNKKNDWVGCDKPYLG